MLFLTRMKAPDNLVGKAIAAQCCRLLCVLSFWFKIMTLQKFGDVSSADMYTSTSQRLSTFFVQKQHVFITVSRHLQVERLKP